MCGIVGILKLNPAARVDREPLEAMRDVLRHRGPDGEGLWLDGPVGLGHRRLAIIDLPGGAQPMSNEDGSVQLVHNGEIYNHLALRADLEARGHRFRSRCDSETIVHLYEEHGEACVERLQGMFAFAIWDSRRHQLLLARDRLGIKPLYYVDTGHELLFASEIKAILAAGSIRPQLDRSVVPEFLATRYVSREETFFSGIKKLLPGHTCSWSLRGGARPRRYWGLPGQIADGSGSPRDLAPAVRRQLGASVDSHLMSDVPVGVFLSGGLDSSVLAAITARLRQDPINTFAVGVDEPGANELPYARRVAQALGARHRDITVTRRDVFAALPKLIWHEDEPIAFPSSALLYFVSMLARSDVKVVLTGEGADELFLGYNWYRVTLWNARLGRPYWALTPPRARGAVRAAVNDLPPPLRRFASRSFLAREADVRSLHCENFAPFPVGLRQRVLHPSLPNAIDPFATWLRAHGDVGSATLDGMSRGDLNTFVVELLMKQDQMSMAASIESRVPFLDHELVEQIAALPARVKLHGLRSKAVLREVARGLVPPEIIRRRKMGFPVPVGRWLRGPSWPLVERVVLSGRALERGLFQPAALRQLADEHRTGRGRHGERLWLLLNLELWQRIFIDGEEPAAMMVDA